MEGQVVNTIQNYLIECCDTLQNVLNSIQFGYIEVYFSLNGVEFYNTSKLPFEGYLKGVWRVL